MLWGITERSEVRTYTFFECVRFHFFETEKEGRRVWLTIA